MARQFSVLANPIPQARRAFPLIAVLQADIADTGDERMVAPMAPRTALPGVAGRLSPIVRAGDSDYVLAVPRMTALPVRLLGEPVGDIADHRDSITAALDYLFQGI